MANVTLFPASPADFLRGSSRIPALRTTFLAQERVTNSQERLRERLRYFFPVMVTVKILVKNIKY